MSGITLKEVADTTIPTPAADKATLFLDAADGFPKYKDDTGTVNSLEGPAGPGVPVGGTVGQVLTKDSGTDYDTSWQTPAGGGDVVGPASAVEDRIATFDGTTGKLIQDSGKTLVQAMTQSFIIACSDETTALTSGTAKATFRMPYAFTVASVRASLTTAQASGSIITVDINEGGSSILSTKITIDNTEKTSTTAATPPVISDTSLADDAEMTIDIDQIGTSGATGLKVALIGYPT